MIYRSMSTVLHWLQHVSNDMSAIACQKLHIGDHIGFNFSLFSLLILSAEHL